MNIDITKIVNDKIAQLEADGTIEKQITDSVEKTVVGAIKDGLESYSLRRDIEKKVQETVSDVAAQIGFSAYNGFIAEKVKQITENVMQADIAQKIQQQFDDMLVAKHDGIKISEIINKYRDWLMETTEESDKWERRNFQCSVEDKQDGGFHHYTVKLSEEALSGYDRANFEIRICTYGEKEKSNISRLYFDGDKLGNGLKISMLNPIETLLANLYYNKTEIVLDWDDVDDSDYYDIDN